MTVYWLVVMNLSTTSDQYVRAEIKRENDVEITCSRNLWLLILGHETLWNFDKPLAATVNGRSIVFMNLKG